MAPGEGSHQHPQVGVRRLVAMYEGAACIGRHNSILQAKELAMALALPLRGLRGGLSGLLKTSDPTSPTCSTSCQNKIGDEPCHHNRSAIRASTGCLSVCTTMEGAETPCNSPPHPSSATSSIPDSPLRIFKSSDYPPCATSAESSFLPSYLDLNCTRVAAFVDVAAAPSMLAGCKNGVYSASPPPSCLTSRDSTPRGYFQQHESDADSIDSSVRLTLLRCHHAVGTHRHLACTTVPLHSQT
jgi:hypothetical protein